MNYLRAPRCHEYLILILRKGTAADLQALHLKGQLFFEHVTRLVHVRQHQPIRMLIDVEEYGQVTALLHLSLRQRLLDECFLRKLGSLAYFKLHATVLIDRLPHEDAAFVLGLDVDLIVKAFLR